MVRADVLYLISETQPHGVFDDAGEEERQVFCNVRSVTRNEAYAAYSQGLHPEYVFELSDVAEYRGEKLCVFNNVRYRIIRTYAASQYMELVAERVVGYAPESESGT